MLTQRAIARDWGVSHVYVSKCVAKGCPTDSFEHARMWRDAHARNRPPTNPKQLAKLEEGRSGRPQPTHNGHSAETMDGTLRNSIMAADEAYRLLQEAMLEGKDSKISIRLGVHNKAVEARIKAETMIREEQERRSILIPLAKAQEITRMAFEVIIKRLTSLPQNIAPRANPHDPAHALEILESECTGIIAAAQQAIQ